jgi:hypothetical protein
MRLSVGWDTQIVVSSFAITLSQYQYRDHLNKSHPRSQNRDLGHPVLGEEFCNPTLRTMRLSVGWDTQIVVSSFAITLSQY